MTAFLAALTATVLPGDDGGPHGDAPLPSGAFLALDAAGHAEALALVAAEAGGEGAFVAANAEGRAEILARAEAKSPDRVRAFVAACLDSYYQDAAVIAAMGWRLAPPQPRGHDVPDTASECFPLLDRVTARGPIWRDPRGRS